MKEGRGITDSDDNSNQEFSVPAHLKDLQEADLPENQRGIVLSEIAQFRERAMKKEKDKVDRERTAAATMGRGLGSGAQPPSGPAGYGQAPKQHWGPQNNYPPSAPQGPQRGWGTGPQGYANKPVGFIRGGEDGSNSSSVDRDRLAKETDKSDEELETERRQARERKEETSFRDVSPCSHLRTECV